jgi:hypothetical protein
MAINGVSTQPPHTQTEQEAQTNSRADHLSCGRERHRPDDTAVIAAFSRDGKHFAARKFCGREPLVNRTGLLPDDEHNLLRRTDGRPTGGYGNRTDNYQEVQARRMTAQAGELCREQRVKDTGIPENLTHGDLTYLVQYRKDQYKAAFLKANENKLNIGKALAGSTEGVRKAFAELSEALTEQDLAYLVQYRREQLAAAKTRERTLRPQEKPSYDYELDYKLDYKLREPYAEPYKGYKISWTDWEGREVARKVSDYTNAAMEQARKAGIDPTDARFRQHLRQGIEDVVVAEWEKKLQRINPSGISY